MNQPYELPEKRITEFIQKHHVFALATSAANVPYSSSCFYVYLPDRNLFVFTSSAETRHAAEMMQQPLVAGAIALETTIVGRIQGIQFTGKSARPKGDLLELCHTAYLKKFPVAVLKKLDLWMIEPDYIKMTHNRLGFGKKLIWIRGEGSKL